MPGLFYPIGMVRTKIFVDILKLEDQLRGAGRLIVTPEHTKGHFKPELGISLLPGSAMIEAAAQTLGLIALGGKLETDSMPLFQGISGPVEYKNTAKPGDILTINGQITEKSRRGFRGNVAIVNQDNKDVAFINGIEAGVLKLQVAKRLMGIK